MTEYKLLVAILLGGLAALKGVGYLPQAPADALEPLSKAMSGSALHSNPWSSRSAELVSPSFS